jgi:hypothetical protein
MLESFELARRTASGIEIRASGLRLRWDLAGLATSDGHIARGSFSATARALSQPTELRMLDEALLGAKGAVSVADVVAHFNEPLLLAAKKFSRSFEAQSLLGDDTRQKLCAVLMDAAAAVAFSCGLEIIQPASVDLDCPDLQKAQFEELDRQAAQRRSAEQMDQLRRSAELFGQFQAIRASAPELSPGQVLSRIGTSDQADVLRSLMLASAKNSASSRLWAVAGNSLVRIEGADTAHAEMIVVPEKLGPLRSIRSGDGDYLLLGCRSGVMRLNPESPGEAIQYADPETTSQLGYNAAVVMGERLWAAHGEGGLVCWMLNQPEKPVSATRPSLSKIRNFAPRNLCRLDENRLLFSTGGLLALCSNDGQVSPLGAASEADIVGIFNLGEQVLTAHADGQVAVWNAADLRVESRVSRAGRVCAAAVLPWLGDARLLLASENGPVLCVGTDDELLTQYSCPYPGLRMIAAAADAVAAVTADRQRLVLWDPWDGRKPNSESFIYGLAKHRVADIAFI